MTIPTPEALREAVERARAAATYAKSLYPPSDAARTMLRTTDADLILAAADLLLSEEWQGMAEVCKAHYEIDHNTPLWDIEAREQLVLHNAISLGRKLAAQEQEK